MKKTILLCLTAIACSAVLHAQSGNVGINTNTPGSNLSVNGSIAAKYRGITATSYNMAADDYYLLWNGASTGTITLPVSVANMTGRMYIIRNSTPGTTLLVNTQPGESTSLGTQITVPYNGGVDLMQTGATTGTTWDVMQFRSSQTVGGLVHSANKIGIPVNGLRDTVSLGQTKDVNGCIDTVTSIRPILVNVTANAYAAAQIPQGAGQGEFILTIDGVAVTSAYYSSNTTYNNTVSTFTSPAQTVNTSDAGSATDPVTSFTSPPQSLSSALLRVPTPGTLFYTAVLPAGTHIIKLQVKAWFSSGGVAPHEYNVDAVATGYGGAAGNASRDALKPMMMVTAYTQ
jgi:hypothetical protein